jgi:pilus assembly protein TadC
VNISENVYQQIVIVAAALFFAFVIWYLASQIKITRSKVERRMQKFLEDEEVSVFDKWGDKYLSRFTITGIEHNLMWAKRSGKFKTWTSSGILMRCILYGLAAYVVFMQNFGISMISVAITAGVALYPILQVRGEAESVQRQVSRMLPEVATLIAVEMRAGSSMDTALSRVAEMPTTIGRLFREALAEQSRTNRPLWSSGSAIGVFVDYMNKQAASGMPQLQRFAKQLDRVSGKGVDSPRVIAKVAEGFSREYKATVTKAAATLDTKLVFPIMIFYFMPFLLAIGLPLFMSVLSAF